MEDTIENIKKVKLTEKGGLLTYKDGPDEIFSFPQKSRALLNGKPDDNTAAIWSNDDEDIAEP